MRLTLHSQLMEHVVVIRCRGRIVAGAEVDALQAEMDKHAEIRKKVVLHVAEVAYIDSSGLGALVRAFGVLRAAGGSLQLCQVSPSVLQVLEVTKLLSVPNWDWHAFDLDRDVALIDEKAGFINAVNPDLSAFKAHGGKLIQYHGWNDQLISAENSVNYHASVLTKMGPRQDDWYRLFMAPGMMHCGGGPGPNQFNGMAVLERWRESGIPPDQITAYHVENNRVTMTRPLCPYPQVAIYKGSGSTNHAENFACKAP